MFSQYHRTIAHYCTRHWLEVFSWIFSSKDHAVFFEGVYESLFPSCLQRCLRDICILFPQNSPRRTGFGPWSLYHVISPSNWNSLRDVVVSMFFLLFVSCCFQCLWLLGVSHSSHCRSQDPHQMWRLASADRQCGAFQSLLGVPSPQKKKNPWIHRIFPWNRAWNKPSKIMGVSLKSSLSSIES